MNKRGLTEDAFVNLVYKLRRLKSPVGKEAADKLLELARENMALHSQLVDMETECLSRQ